MNLSFNAKDAFNHVKGRKFLYVLVTFVIIVFWALIGMNSVKPGEYKTLIVWITESSSDKTEITQITDDIHYKYKKWGFKEYYVSGGGVSSKDDKIIFTLNHRDVDFYIMPKARIDEYSGYFADLTDLVDTDDFDRWYKKETEEEVNGETVTKEKILGIVLSEDYVFAVSEVATVPDGVINDIIEFVKAFSFTTGE